MLSEGSGARAGEDIARFGVAQSHDGTVEGSSEVDGRLHLSFTDKNGCNARVQRPEVQQRHADGGRCAQPQM